MVEARLTEAQIRALSAYADGEWRSSVTAAEMLLLPKYAHGNFGRTVRWLMLKGFLRFAVNVRKVVLYQITEAGLRALESRHD
ncbi:MAG: hypothetical protein ACTHJQ_03345 [Rhizobiaceae bacterium]